MNSLPRVLFQKICSFLSGYDITSHFYLVCKCWYNHLKNSNSNRFLKASLLTCQSFPIKFRKIILLNVNHKVLLYIGNERRSCFVWFDDIDFSYFINLGHVHNINEYYIKIQYCNPLFYCLTYENEFHILSDNFIKKRSFKIEFLDRVGNYLKYEYQIEQYAVHEDQTKMYVKHINNPQLYEYKFKSGELRSIQAAKEENYDYLHFKSFIGECRHHIEKIQFFRRCCFLQQIEYEESSFQAADFSIQYVEHFLLIKDYVLDWIICNNQLIMICKIPCQNQVSLKKFSLSFI